MIKKCVPFLLLGLCIAVAARAEVMQIGIWDQKVAIVNTEAICKRDVEEHMGGIAEKLQGYKKEMQLKKMWNPEQEAQWTSLYIDSFRDALRRIVRERLMLQYFAREKMTIDEKAVAKQQAEYITLLHQNGVKNIDVADISKRIRESEMLKEFRGKFDNAMEYPKKPEVETFYRSNLEKFQRKAGLKVRMIRIDYTVMDKLTGSKIVREKPYDMLVEIRRDIVDMGGSFVEMAKVKNDDQELRDRGGLLMGPNNDPYIVPDEYNKVLASGLRGMTIGDVSAQPFEFGKGFAIMMVEDKREAGPEPLEGKLYEKIYNEMYANKRLKKEDEWFRTTLAKTLVAQVVDGNNRILPIEFFFPDDKKTPDFVADPKSNVAGADKKKKDEKEPK